MKYRAGEPCTGNQFRAGGVHNETAARRLVFFVKGDHLIALAGFRRTAVEDAVRYMDNGKRLWIILHQFATKREPAANVVPVTMRQNDFLHTPLTAPLAVP